MDGRRHLGLACYLLHIRPRIFLNEFGRVQRVRETYLWACATSVERRERDISHCASCLDVGDFLCDFPVGESKTCDRPMCEDHRHSVAPELDYCDAHYPEWAAFRDSNALAAHFKGVVPFGRER